MAMRATILVHRIPIDTPVQTSFGVMRDRPSVTLRVEDDDGAVGWGETYGLVAPKAVAAIIDDLLGPYLKTLAPDTPDKAWDALYELQRVRGYWGGYLGDALAALDIALWDLHARSGGQSLQAALGQDLSLIHI